ncbi:MAG: hypothetical protein QOH88_1447 [Verrucomicrobiota bacterium]|jgi:hypothetical protein
MNIRLFRVGRLVAITSVFALSRVDLDAAPQPSANPTRPRVNAIVAPTTVKPPKDVPTVEQPVIDPGQVLVFTNGEGLATSNTNLSGDVKPSLKSSAEVSVEGCHLQWQIPTPALSALKGTLRVMDPATGTTLNSFPVTIPAKQSSVIVAYKFPAQAEMKSYTAAVFLARGVSSSKAILKNTGGTAAKLKLPGPTELPADLEIVDIRTTRNASKAYAYLHTNSATIRNKGIGASKGCQMSFEGFHPVWDQGNNKTLTPVTGTTSVPAILAGKESVIYFDSNFQPRSATINPDHKILESSYENNTWAVDPAKILPDEKTMTSPHHDKKGH